VRDGEGGVEQVDAAHGLLDRAEPERGEVLADLLGDELKKLTTNSGLPENRLRSSGFWVATPTGQVSR